MRRRINDIFPGIGVACFEAREILDYAENAGDYVLDKLAETEHECVILVNGLEKILLSKRAQKIFLELYVSWHASGKLIYITTAAPQIDGLGWNEHLLSKLKGYIYEV